MPGRGKGGQRREAAGAARVAGFQRLAWMVLAWMVLAWVVCASAAARPGEALIFLGDRDLPPYEYLHRDQPRGANVDLALAVGKVLQRPVEVRLVDWGEAQARLLAGEGHALTMLGRTEEREASFDFTQPTFPVAFALFVRAGEEDAYASGKLDGKRIGVTRGGLPRAHLEANHPEATLVFLNNVEDGVRRLVAHDIDAFAAQTWTSFFLLKALGVSTVTALPPFAERRGNIAVRRVDASLAREIDAALEHLKATGEFYRIIDQWSHTRVHLLSNATVRVAAVAAAVAIFALLLLGYSLHRLSRQKTALAREVDERRRAEAELRESEQRYRTMGEAIPYGVWLCNADGGAEYASQSFLDLLGMTQEEMRDFGWTHRLPPDDVRPALDAWLQCVRTGKPWDAEHRVLGPDGAYHHVLTRGLPVRGPDGRITCWVGIHLDIDKRKSMEDALREADRRKDEFLATLAHELRNPLAPIRNAVKIMSYKAPADPTLKAARDIIDRQVQHMVRLIDDLLDVSRITRGKLELRRQRVTLNSVLNDAVETHGPGLQHHLVVELPREPILLDADPDRLTQVFANLLNNACKFTNEGGRITVAAERSGGDVLVRVKDTGIGICPTQLPALFEMFSQVGTALDRSQGGLGIGLSLARGLVEMHGGSIEARSEGLGKGAEFVVRLPAVVETAPPRCSSTDDAASVEQSGSQRVLVADDNRDAAESLATLLRFAGNDVEIAYDGLEAISKAEQQRPDTILLDIGMPKLNGYAACRKIREQPWGRKSMIVALSGWGQQADREKSTQAGFDAHLVKPVDPDVLARLLSGRAQASHGEVGHEWQEPTRASMPGGF